MSLNKEILHDKSTAAASFLLNQNTKSINNKRNAAISP